MSRLPTPDGDDGKWGNILNDFLLVAHNPDGTLKNTGGVSDANASTKGIVQLGGDLAGTAAAPTVPGKIDKSTLTTKGDILVASSAATVTRVGVGSDYQVVVADSTQTTGLKWAGVPDTTEVINVKTHGVVGNAVNDETTKIQSVMALSAWPYPKRVFFPTGDYKISNTLTIPQSSMVMGVDWQASRFYPANGMSVPVFDFGVNGGSTLRDIAIWNGGSAGTPAVVIGGQQQKLTGLDIRGWQGDGVHVTVQNFSTIRNVNISNAGGNGIVVGTTFTLLEGVTSNSNGGNGFVLNNSLYSNGSGTLVGCVSEGNSGHGFYITGGQWDLQVYGESNLGDLIHVDGSQQYDLSMTLSVAATAGDTSITVAGLTKGLPEKGILRFSDGTAVVVNNDGAGPTISLKSPITTNQANGASITLAPEDIPPAKLPTVRIRPGTHDGTIYLHACNFAFESGFMPIGGSVVATASAHMIGDAGHVLTAKGNNRTWGGGGSNVLAGSVGSTTPIVPSGLAHVANPTSEYILQHSYTNAYIQDNSVPGGFYLQLLAQYNWAQTALGWEASSLSPGDYTLRALVRNTAQTPNGINFVVNGGPNKTFTTRSTGWEWINLDFTQTQAGRQTTSTIFVQRTGATEVDVAAIVIMPRTNQQVTPGTWLNPAWIGGTDKIAEWVDGSGKLRLSVGAPANDLDSDIALTTNTLQIGANTSVISGTGAPEGVVTAAIGSIFSRTDGSAGTTLYIKQAGTGSTGWAAVGSGGSGGGVISGAGSPEGTAVASVGTLYSRTDGGPGTAVYVKEVGNGNTGWTALGAGAGSGGGAVSFKTSYFDVPNNYGSTSWAFTAINSNGSSVGGIPYFGGYNQSGSGTGIEELSYNMYIQGGTWNFVTYHVVGPNLGVYTVLIDGTESSSVDTYTGSYTSLMVPVLTGTSLTTGVHTITIRKKGAKNVSSSDYYILWSGLMGIRVGA